MKRVIVAAALALLVPLAAQAGDAEAGKARSVVCAACHGPNGIAVIPGYPNLAGQNEQYLISQLKAYRSKERSGGLSAVMYGQAAMLNDDDIANLAAYYANLKP